MTPDLIAFILICVVMVCATTVVCVHKLSRNVPVRDDTLEELTRCVCDLATLSMNAAMVERSDQIERIRIENEDPPPPSGLRRGLRPSVPFPSPMDMAMNNDGTLIGVPPE